MLKAQWDGVKPAHKQGQAWIFFTLETLLKAKWSDDPDLFQKPSFKKWITNCSGIRITAWACAHSSCMPYFLGDLRDFLRYIYLHFELRIFTFFTECIN